LESQRAVYLADCEAQGIEPVDMATYRERLIDELLLFRAAQRHPSTADSALLTRVEAQRRRLIVDHFIDSAFRDELSVSDEEIESFHADHRDQFTVPAQANALQMRFDEQEAAEAAQRRLAAGEEDFEALGEELGGEIIDLGWFSRGRFDQEIEETVFALGVGDVSEVLSTDVGFLVLMRVGASPERVRPLEEVAEEIRVSLIAARRRELLRSMLDAERRAEGIDSPPVLVP
jgi:parvulin-like peptidyl-prolyl isomerase